jgi:hypothetical protein
MPRFGPQFVFTTVALIGALIGSTQPVQAGKASEGKGAKIYCFMRSSGNDHNVSWNAAYAVIKRQGVQIFKTSPEHAAVIITEAVVQDPGNFPDCGRYLGDLFGGSPNKATTTTSLGTSTTGATNSEFSSVDGERYSY